MLKKRKIPWVVLPVLLLHPAPVSAGDGEEDPRRPRLPELEIVTLDGVRITSEALRGKVVLLDFWGTWCPPCVASIPHLKRLSVRTRTSPFVLLSISNDADGEALRRFVARHGMTWPQIWDEDGHLSGELFKVETYPTFVLVDREGVIVYRQSGWGEGIARALDAQIDQALRAAPDTDRESFESAQVARDSSMAREVLRM